VFVTVVQSQGDDELNCWRADVLVVGGGTAGVTAAIAAAEEGADVVLVERDSGLGGVGVRAGVHYYYLGTTGGIQDSLDETAQHLNAQMGSTSKTFLPESKALAIEKRFTELRIRTVYEAVVSEVIMDGVKVRGVIVESERDSLRIEAVVTVDATGDGDIAYLAGAEYTLGREWDGGLHNYSLVPRYVDEKNQLRCKNFDIGWADITDIGDVSRAYRIGRRHAWRGEEDPSNTHYTVIGPQLGVREGRLVQGEYILKQDDLLLDRRFDDVVMRCFAHHENHAFDYANESEWSQIWVAVLGMWRFGFGGDVPYRCLIPRGIEGLLIGSRAFSQDHDNAVMLRMQRDLHKIGEVAGTAAAWSVKEAVSPKQVNISYLQERLIARGVLNAQDILHRASAPWLKFKGESADDRQRPLDEGIQTADVQTLIRHLGGVEESIALWWLWQFGDVSVEPLLEVLNLTEGRQQRGAAFALGLLRHPASVPFLVWTFRSRDTDRPNELTRTEERWLAALILLKLMKDASVAVDVPELLIKERRSATLLFLLHYMIAVADQLDDSLKEETITAVIEMLSDKELGNDYMLHGAGPAIDVSEDTRSMRWGLELTASYLLELIGGPGQGILEQYRHDHRAYARTAADKLIARLSEAKGAIPSHE
jgi:hypothetical protein